MKEIRIGLMGAGRASQIHYDAYQCIKGIPIKFRGIAALPQDEKQLLAAKERYGFEYATTNYKEILADPDIDVIDIVAPPVMHIPIIKEALEAGKHVLCEKPLTGYFGMEGDEAPIGDKVSKQKMYERMMVEVEELRRIVESTDKVVGYCENFVYAPAVLRAADIIRSKKSRILYMFGEESAHGSPSPVAGDWKFSGGGSLTRCGTHPIAACIWLKQQEAEARGVEIHPVSVQCETSRLLPGLSDYERRHLISKPLDVEDTSVCIIRFSDGSVANVVSTDTWVGGIRAGVQIYCNDNYLDCKLSQNDILTSYLLDEDGIEGMKLEEGAPGKLGFTHPNILHDDLHGYANELQDFMGAIWENRKPKSSFTLAYDTVKVMYGAYCAAESGTRFIL